jgi:hypothetical protein
MKLFIIIASILIGIEGGFYNGNKIYGMIRKLKSGEFRIYSIKLNPATKKRRNLGTFKTLDEAKNHERQIEYFKKLNT